MLETLLSNLGVIIPVAAILILLILIFLPGYVKAHLTWHT